MGIEPTLSAWEAEVLPLNYTRAGRILNRLMIHISVNGASRECAAGATVATLVEALALAGKRIAVERNGSIVPRSRWGEAHLEEGDRLEIVGAVGGG